jgi:acylglycerol lipase
VRSFDQRGWGRSVKKASDKGWTGDTNLVLSDITEFIKTNLPAPAPLFLMGHSMGGGEVLCWISSPSCAEVKKHIRGYLLESPFIAFNPASKPGAITVAVGKLAGKLLPHHQMVNKLDEKLLSRDPAVQKAVVDDQLCHDTGTLEGLAGLLDRASSLDSGKIKIAPNASEGNNTRIWLSHGTADGVCDYTGTANFYKRLSDIKDKEFKTYTGWFHKRML